MKRNPLREALNLAQERTDEVTKGQPRERQIIVAREMSKRSPYATAHYKKTLALGHLDELIEMTTKYSITLRVVSQGIERLFRQAPHSPEMLAAQLRAWQNIINGTLEKFGDAPKKAGSE